MKAKAVRSLGLIAALFAAILLITYLCTRKTSPGVISVLTDASSSPGVYSTQ